MEQITLTLTKQQLNLIAKALSRLPYFEVVDTIKMLIEEVKGAEQKEELKQ